eukprot:gb/GEZJ01004835.1/.p1 GENE.gb/GEZJ01004835.1/~~gb/GEZJ01004835.1/.p1  ORF type:complete len:190 (-),score=3.23 gb/GEZJ01004835.1/:154-723(-)
MNSKRRCKARFRIFAPAAATSCYLWALMFFCARFSSIYSSFSNMRSSRRVSHSSYNSTKPDALDFFLTTTRLSPANTLKPSSNGFEAGKSRSLSKAVVATFIKEKYASSNKAPFCPHCAIWDLFEEIHFSNRMLNAFVNRNRLMRITGGACNCGVITRGESTSAGKVMGGAVDEAAARHTKTAGVSVLA